MLLFTAFLSDTDCDGTTYSAMQIVAKNLMQAEAIASTKGYDLDGVIPEIEFLTSDRFLKLDDWNQSYYQAEGFTTMGADWNPWVEDDSIGIPALDSRYDD